jgi:hypothetical protein
MAELAFQGSLRRVQPKDATRGLFDPSFKCQRNAKTFYTLSLASVDRVSNAKSKHIKNQNSAKQKPEQNQPKHIKNFAQLALFEPFRLHSKIKKSREN